VTLEIYRPDLPRTPGKLGKLAPTFPIPLHYLTDLITLPDAPASVQREQFINVAWGMLGNDRYGDCTFAGYVHLVMAVGALLGLHITAPTAARVVAAYLAFSHGVDQGAVEATVLQTGYATGLCELSLAGYAKGKGGVAEAEQIIATFGASYDGVMLTQSDMEQFQNGQPWSLTSTRSIIGGHCIVRVEYTRDAGLFKALTWGVEHLVTYEWYEARCDEQWAVIPSIVKSSGLGVGAFDWAQLEADLHALVGAVG